MDHDLKGLWGLVAFCVQDKSVTLHMYDPAHLKGPQGLDEYQWETGESCRLLTAPIIEGVVADIQRRVPTAVISARFHATLIRLFAEFCDFVRRQNDLNRVVLSGGCFQNATLLSGLIQALHDKKFEVFTHQQVPANDGGISLGQAVAAAAIARRA